MYDALARARLLLVDDTPAVLRQVIQLITDEFELVEALEDGSDLQDAVTKHERDVVILDITLPHASGLVLASALGVRGPRPKIVFLTVHDDPDYVAAAFSAGASGYVVKTRLSLELLPALHAVLEGRGSSRGMPPATPCATFPAPFHVRETRMDKRNIGRVLSRRDFGRLSAAALATPLVGSRPTDSCRIAGRRSCGGRPEDPTRVSTSCSCSVTRSGTSANGRRGFHCRLTSASSAAG